MGSAVGRRAKSSSGGSAANGTLSANGRWFAYPLFSGRAEVYVVAYGGGQGKSQVSPNGGRVPQWIKDGKELYHLDGAQSIVAVPVKDLPTLT
ncbi:MAG: hypothetical protein WB762_32185 [Candidatus Sulfotelmatobacter sp.]